MIEALKFVQGAVAQKDFVPELTHFKIASGHIMGFNGHLALCSPIDLDIEACPKASTFTKAVLSCGDKTSLSLTPTGRLAIKSGGFKAYIECIPDLGFTTYPVGEAYAAPDNLLEALRVAVPFIGQDASRLWSMAVHLEDSTLYVTNNIIAMRVYTGMTTPPLTIPHNAVRELLRINEKPTAIQTDQSSLTFWYADNKWMRCQLVEQQWPVAQLGKILDDTAGDLQDIPENFYDGLEKLKPFVTEGSRISFCGNHIATHDGEGLGATYDLEGLPTGVAYSRDQLALLNGVADKIYLGTQRARFTGCPNGLPLTGVVMGMVKADQ